MAVEQEIALMLEEIEGVIRKYRLRLQGGTSGEIGIESPEIKRLKILRFVNENGSVFPEELYALADEMGMSRQGLGGYFRGASSGNSLSTSLLKYESDRKPRKIVIGNYGLDELARLERLHPSW